MYLLVAVFFLAFVSCDDITPTYVDLTFDRDHQTRMIPITPIEGASLYWVFYLNSYSGFSYANPIVLQSKPKTNGTWEDIFKCELWPNTTTVGDEKGMCYHYYNEFDFTLHDYQLKLTLTDGNGTMGVIGMYLLTETPEPFKVKFSRSGSATTGNYYILPVLPRVAYIEGSVVSQQDTELYIATQDGNIKNYDPTKNLLFGWGVRNPDFSSKWMQLDVYNLQTNPTTTIDVEGDMWIGIPSVLTEEQKGPAVVTPTFHLGPSETVNINFAPGTAQGWATFMGTTVRLSFVEDNTLQCELVEPDPKKEDQSASCDDIDDSKPVSLQMTNIVNDKFVTTSGIIGVSPLSDEAVDISMTYTFELPESTVVTDDGSFYLFDGIQSVVWSLDAEEAGLNVDVKKTYDGTTTSVYTDTTTAKVTAATTVDMITPADRVGATRFDVTNPLNGTVVRVNTMTLTQKFSAGSGPKKHLSGGAIAGIVIGVLAFVIIVIVAIAVVVVVVMMIRKKKSQYAPV